MVAVAVAKPSTLSPKSIEHMGTANNTENKYNYVLTSDFHAVIRKIDFLFTIVNTRVTLRSVLDSRTSQTSFTVSRCKRAVSRVMAKSYTNMLSGT